MSGYTIVRALVRVPPHADFEQGSGHRHEALEEVYLAAVSQRREQGDATKVEDFWEPSARASQGG